MLGARRALLGLAPPVLRRGLARARDELQLRRFHATGRVPWTAGYHAYRERVVLEALADAALAAELRRGAVRPGYGIGIDERCIELPWALGHLPFGNARLFDAGSALNHAFLLDQPRLRDKTIHILTLGPEGNCFFDRGISYLYGDLRDVPIRDGYFEYVTCISTLEHIGLDNSSFTGSEKHRESSRDDFERAMAELSRVLAPGGTLLLTVPFGAHQRFAGFQQFDSELLGRAIAAFGATREVEQRFFRYEASGWAAVSVDACRHCRYVDWLAEGGAPSLEPDRAAAARAVACVRLVKR